MEVVVLFEDKMECLSDDCYGGLSLVISVVM